MKRFGQYVRLSFSEEGGAEIFSADSLRIDFDIRLLAGINKAKLDVYNMNAETISKLDHDGIYITVYTSLHGGTEAVLIDNLYVNNMTTETKVPNSVTTFYCADALRRGPLDSPVDSVIEGPTLRTIIQGIVDSANSNSQYNIKMGVEYKMFPDGYLDSPTPAQRYVLDGKANEELKRLSYIHGLKTYTLHGNLIVCYQPRSENVEDRFFAEGDKVILSVDRMKQNPILGSAEASITSNLDPDILPFSVLDVSQLLNSRTVGDDQAILETNKQFLNDIASGISSYIVMSVQHLGSNYTSTWETRANSVTPLRGSELNSQNWNK